MSPGATAVALLVATSVIGSPPIAAEIAVRVGSEFQVSAYTSPYAAYPAVASAADGDFVVVWQSYHHRDFWNVVARRFNSDGVAEGSEFQVNSYTGWAYGQPWRVPAIASSNEGGFVVVWSTLLNGNGPVCPCCDHQAHGLFSRRFEANGDPGGAELQIDEWGAIHSQGAIETDDDGAFIVAWHRGSFCLAPAVRARRFDSGGIPQGTEIDSLGSGANPALAVNGDGDSLVVWTNGDVFGRRFDSTGLPRGAAFQVNSQTLGYQRNPAAQSDTNGGFTIVWQSNAQDGSGDGVFARRVDSTGMSIGSEFQINAYTRGHQQRPRIDSDGESGHIVVWMGGNDQDGSSSGIFARRLAADGAALAVEFQVNGSTLEAQTRPDVAVADDGSFVVIWEDGRTRGILGQRFALTEPAVLDIDADGATLTLTDGLLLVREAFAFTGTPLVLGAVGTGCNRCDAASIEAYISGLGLTLDVDDDGEVGALTDAILILRFLSGFTGMTLTSGAVGDDCSRCDAPAIVPYLETLD